MGNIERSIWLVVTLALLGALTMSRTGSAASAVVRPRAHPGVRLSMDALHQQGGVPLGWQLTMPPGNAAAGRATFDALGCPACHRVADGTANAGGTASTGTPNPIGPELTGMGSHHSPAYFAEALLNPDAVLIDGPGYVGEDGHSTMPAYPDMTLGELSDVVAYLASLTQGTLPSCHAAAATTMGPAITMTVLDLDQRPDPPRGAARAFFVQTYDVLPGQLAAFETWFATQGRGAFQDADGVVSLETFIDAAKPSAPLTTLVGFRDEAALRNFMRDPATAELWKTFDAFVGPHGHFVVDRPLVYRAPSLSWQ